MYYYITTRRLGVFRGVFRSVFIYAMLLYDSRSKGPKFELPGTHPPGTMAPKGPSRSFRSLADAEAAEQARKNAAFAAMVLKVDAKKAAFAANVESSSAFAAAKAADEKAADEARAPKICAGKAEAWLPKSVLAEPKAAPKAMKGTFRHYGNKLAESEAAEQRAEDVLSVEALKRSRAEQRAEDDRLAKSRRAEQSSICKLADAEAAEQARKIWALKVDAKKAAFAAKAADEKAAFAAFKAAKAADEKAADEAPLAGAVPGTPPLRCFPVPGAPPLSFLPMTDEGICPLLRVDDCAICPLLRCLWVWGTGVQGSINGSIYLYTCILKTNPKDKILKTNPKDKS